MTAMIAALLSSVTHDALLVDVESWLPGCDARLPIAWAVSAGRCFAAAEAGEAELGNELAGSWPGQRCDSWGRSKKFVQLPRMQRGDADRLLVTITTCSK